MLAHLHVAVAWNAGHATVRLRGDLDLSTAPLLAEELAPLVGLATSVVVHASELDFLDLAGVDALLAAERALRDRGAELRLDSPSRAASRLLSLLGDPLPT